MYLKTLSNATRILLRLLGYGIVGGSIALLAVYAYLLESRPDLSVWHHADLDSEFTVHSGVSDFNQYLELENRLFSQLDELVYARVAQTAGNRVNRYIRDSLSDPGRWPVNWNRTFILHHDDPSATVLLLHGLSDSPYSMRSLGQRLHQAGALVLGLRIPGHGTAPSGLVETRWQDMAAAVRLAARHVANKANDKPFYLVGYSNGGALSVDYALSALDDASLPRPSGIVLLSPEIGISGIAALAVWQARLGHLLGLEKLAWNSVVPEYDPFKYGSFPVNAGDLAYRITAHIQDQLAVMQGVKGKLDKLPPVLAFQSAVDATVTPQALVENFFDRLPAAGHELVLFDINRSQIDEALLKHDPKTVFEPLLSNRARSYKLTVVTNDSENSRRVVARSWSDGKADPSSLRHLGEWPEDVYSLSHVALPFAPDDPLYGGPAAAPGPGIALGDLAFRGERGVLRLSGDDLLRLRWNPFFDYMQARMLQFMRLEHP
jgi:alpha-beta hydrolase superfamily lysophospholipase